MRRLLAFALLVLVVRAATTQEKKDDFPPIPTIDLKLKNPVEYGADVEPIFRAKCFSCHGEKRPRAGLDLRSKAALLKGGANGTALKPGSLKDSILWEKIRTDEPTTHSAPRSSSGCTL